MLRLKNTWQKNVKYMSKLLLLFWANVLNKLHHYPGCFIHCFWHQNTRVVVDEFSKNYVVSSVGSRCRWGRKKSKPQSGIFHRKPIMRFTTVANEVVLQSQYWRGLIIETLLKGFSRRPRYCHWFGLAVLWSRFSCFVRKCSINKTVVLIIKHKVLPFKH